MKIFKDHVYKLDGPLSRQTAATISASVPCLVASLTHGITATLLPQLEKDPDFPYEWSEGSWIASISTIFMMIGCFITGPILDRYGRRISFFIFLFPQVLGWIALAFAPNTLIIYIARFLTGVSTGASRPISSVYLGEISDPKYRGVTLFCPSLAMGIGIMSIHLLGMFLYWRTVAKVCVGLSIFSFCLLFPIKESPLWLIANGKVDEGIALFRWFRGDKEHSEKELQDILSRSNEKKQPFIRETIKNIIKPSFLRPILVVLFMCVCIQFSGINAIGFYAVYIFDKTYNGSISPFIIMTLSDVIRLGCCVGICWMGKNFSRRKCFIVCAYASVTFIFALSMIIYVDPIKYKWPSLIVLFFFLVFTSSLNNLGWSFVGEIFPTNLRGIGSSLSSGMAFLALFVILKLTPDILERYGIVALYLTFAAVTFLTVSVLVFILPETHGKSLQDIEDGFSKKKSAEHNNEISRL